MGATGIYWLETKKTQLLPCAENHMQKHIPGQARHKF